MLCDKVQKDDIEIIFSKDSWEAMGEFAQTDVHRQIAIVFKSPPYQDLDIIEEVEVSVVLRRPSDRMHSESVTFTYLPGNPDPYGINRKRKIKPDGNFSTDPCVSACHLTLPEPSAPELLGQFTCAALQHPLTCAASQASGAAVESTPLLPQAELDCYDPDCLEGLSPEDQSVLISVINQIMLESMDVGAPCPAPSVGQNQQLLSAVSEYQALEPSLYDLSLPALEADRLPDLGNIDLNFDLGATPDSQSRQLAGGNEFVNFSHFMFSQSENLPTFLEPHPQDQIGSSSQGIGTGDADVQAEPQACTDPVASGKPGL
ncbi:hypothetical protein JZ751_028290 [Albula glossodonta]|uniref:Rel homology dimerisation domain-containing protein n=1 Tax=Albula glossodonta TaxID=121402 RepID=A0A8T2MPE7_9TELE|nr:hypothetical protein JZ751_028290 [Albula glossodonta]